MSRQYQQLMRSMNIKENLYLHEHILIFDGVDLKDFQIDNDEFIENVKQQIRLCRI